MKFVFLLCIGITATLAQVGEFIANDDSDLQNVSVENDFEGLLNSGELSENDEEAISQAALSILSTGRPNCYLRSNWGQRFRHNWYITRFWECNRWRTDLRSCAIPRLYQPSLQRCVWAWNWRWEPIRRNDETTTAPPATPTTPLPTPSPTTPPPSPTILPPTTQPPTTQPPTTDTTIVWPPPTIETTSTTESTIVWTTTESPGVSRCDAPDCTRDRQVYLQPTWQPNEFIQCTVLGRFVVVQCPFSLLFNYERQACLPASQWVNSC